MTATEPPTPADDATSGTARTTSARGAVSVALVLNPVKVDDAHALVAALTERCARAGLGEPLVRETTEEEPGRAMAREAVESGAKVVVVAGGDGTVRAVAEGLVGSGVALAVVPQGTGNLLVRNLELPTDRDTVLDSVVDGVDRAIDVGRLDDGTVFAVMAGAGFDAAMMRDAPEGLKSAVGWPAYIVGGMRGIRRSLTRVSVSVDGGPPVRARARTVIIGNLGTLQGGLELLPDARPDDGLLDLAVVAPRNPVDWVVLLARGLAGKHSDDHLLRTWQARSVDVRMHRPHPRQVDGDLVDDGARLAATVEPGALVVRFPRRADGPRTPRSDSRGTDTTMSPAAAGSPDAPGTPAEEAQP